MGMSRQQRRGYQRKLKGKETWADVFVNPKIQKPIKLPVGTRLQSANGFHVWVTREVVIKPRWWWKVRSFFSKAWEAKVRVPARFA